MARHLHPFTVIALLCATLPLIQCTELTKVDWTLIQGAGAGGQPSNAGATSTAGQSEAGEANQPEGGASGAADGNAGATSEPAAGSANGGQADDLAGASGTATASGAGGTSS